MGYLVRGRRVQPEPGVCRQVGDEDPERIALRSEKETGETRELSFGGLRDLVGAVSPAP